jgi:glycine/D-amino acid oxidase-like deaminating enzyme
MDITDPGSGYSGLWTALIARERDPSLDVVLVEGHEAGWAASGRNGGFCEASLTHGLSNGHQRWPGELATLEQLGAQNLQAIEDTLTRHGIACDWERTGALTVATEPYQADGLCEMAGLAARYGPAPALLNRDAVRAEIDSPTFLAGLWDMDRVALLNPARLAWGLKQACLDAGVRIHEHTAATGLARSGAGITVRTPHGHVLAHRVALATNAFPSLLRRHRRYTVPVYDYALITEPLTTVQLASIGWRNRQGLTDSTNQFHYARLTADNRILWGGYDAIYHYRARVRAGHDQRPQTFATLARHFARTFPQLDGVRFTHAWGGAIDACTRFCAFFDTSHQGQVAYTAGFTGLGVAATRFAAEVILDLLTGERTERTALPMVRRKPLPFPPEPVRWAAIHATKWSLARADQNAGRRNLWLKTLGRLGLGFDS